MIDFSSLIAVCGGCRDVKVNIDEWLRAAEEKIWAGEGACDSGVHEPLLPLPLGIGVAREIEVQCGVVYGQVTRARQFLCEMVVEHGFGMVDTEYVKGLFKENGAEGLVRVGKRERFRVFAKEPRADALRLKGKYGFVSKLEEASVVAGELQRCVEKGMLGTELMHTLARRLSGVMQLMRGSFQDEDCGVPLIEKEIFRNAGFNFEVVEEPGSSFMVEFLGGGLCPSPTGFLECPPVSFSVDVMSSVRALRGAAAGGAFYTCELGWDLFDGRVEQYIGHLRCKGREQASAFVNGRLCKVESGSHLLAVYGVPKQLGSASKLNHSLVAVHDRWNGKVYCLFSGQGLSNFNEAKSISYKGLDVCTKDGGQVCVLQHLASEQAFQLAKAVFHERWENVEKVLQAEDPGAAKAATNAKNMPGCKEEWREKSIGVMAQALARKLTDKAGFYGEVVGLLEFCRDVCNVTAENVEFIENTDDRRAKKLNFCLPFELLTVRSRFIFASLLNC